jgi:bifunctional DNA-binding transcriptional regulator/antitoxin component of YhaV-PrlF toxin-antitoxin module
MAARPLMNTGKIQNKSQVTIPTAIARRAGLQRGDLVHFAFQRGKIVITPKIVIDGSSFPTAENEYTPAQRRDINRGIAQSESEYRAERGFGPFATHAEFINSLHQEAAKHNSRKSKRASK